MNFALDSDLLVARAGVFLEAGFDTQELVRVEDAAVTGPVVTSATGGLAGLVPGQVVVLQSSEADAVCRAIVSVTDDNTISVSPEPWDLAGASDLRLSVRTFEPQITLIHGQLMRAIGLDPADASHGLDEANVVSVEVMRHLEVLGTLWRVYEGSAAEEHRALAEHYRGAFAAAMEGARVLIDVDGGGWANDWRQPTVGWMRRV